MRHFIFLPVFALIAFLVFGAGTVLADSSNEGVGGWGSEAVEAGQITLGVPGTLSGIDAPSTSHATGSEPAGDEPNRRAFVGKLVMDGSVFTATGGGTGTYVATNIYSISVKLQTSGEEERPFDIGLPAPVTVGVDGLAYSDGSADGHPYIKFPAVNALDLLLMALGL